MSAMCDALLLGLEVTVSVARVTLDSKADCIVLAVMRVAGLTYASVAI